MNAAVFSRFHFGFYHFCFDFSWSYRFSTFLGMPPMTFLALEAVSWIQEHVEGVENEATATRILKNMQEKKLICHASGSFLQTFYNGFAFFCLNPNPKAAVEAPYNGNLETFKNDWVEVEFSGDSSDDFDSKYEFLQESLTKFAAKQRKREALAAKSFYKSVTLNVDTSSRSDRKEWGHIKYQHYYDTTEAFEIALQWSVATGKKFSSCFIPLRSNFSRFLSTLLYAPHLRFTFTLLFDVLYLRSIFALHFCAPLLRSIFVLCLKAALH